MVSFVRLFYITGSKIQCQKENVDRANSTIRNSRSYILKEGIGKPKQRIVKNIIQNIIQKYFSSYTLTSGEEYELSFSLDQHTPTKYNTHNIKTEFESFFCDIQKHTKHLDKELQDELKTKRRRTCENCSKLKVSSKHRKIIDKLSKNTDIIILRQDKGRGVIILNRKDYIQKFVSIINTSQSRKLDNDPD